MTEKVKRGLGLLVVALLAAIAYLVLRTPEGFGATEGLAVTARIAAVGCGIWGLVLLAWGLLAD